MGQIKELTEAAVSDLRRANSQPPSKSASALPKRHEISSGKYEVSLYVGDLPTKDELRIASNRLAIAFPKMSKEFFALLNEFVITQGFTAQRLSDAVNHTIANFRYKELNISDIVSFDKRIPLYTGMEVYKMRNAFPHPDFKLKELDGNRFWILKSDLVKNGYKTE